MAHFCESCQMIHSSSSCYHPSNKLQALLTEIEGQLNEALHTLKNMVREHCENEDGYLLSLDSVANADAMRLLAKHGRLKVIFPLPPTG